jgi:hypothetical protein
MAPQCAARNDIRQPPHILEVDAASPLQKAMQIATRHPKPSRQN